VDLFAAIQLAGPAYLSTTTISAASPTIISDQIYERITGEKGYFDSRLVFITTRTVSPKDGAQAARMMDQRWRRQRYPTNGSDLVLTPRFSP